MLAGADFEWRNVADFDDLAWSEFHRFWTELNREHTPYRENPSLENFREKWTSFSDRIVICCFVIQRKGLMVAAGRYWREAETSPHFETNKTVFNTLLWAKDRPDRANTLEFLYRSLAEVSEAKTAKTWQIILSQAALQRYFVDSFDFQTVNHLEEFGLMKDEIDSLAIARAQASVPRMQFRRMDPVAEIEAIADLYTKTYHDSPFQGAQRAIIDYDVHYFKDRFAQLERQGEQLYIFGLFGEEKFLGLTLLQSKREEPAVFETDFTGILKSARGRGLGKRIKAEAIQYLVQNIPSFKVLLTGNNESNAPMLVINKSLGFKLLNDYYIVQAPLVSRPNS